MGGRDFGPAQQTVSGSAAPPAGQGMTPSAGKYLWIPQERSISLADSPPYLAIRPRPALPDPLTRVSLPTDVQSGRFLSSAANAVLPLAPWFESRENLKNARRSIRA